MNDDTKARLERIKAFVEALPKQVWRVMHDHKNRPFVTFAPADWKPDPMAGYANLGIWTDEGVTSREIAEFIAAAREDVPFLLEEIDKLAKDYNQACTNLLVEGEYNKAVVVERDEARAEVERLRAVSERRKKALELPIAALECQYPILGCKHDKGAGSCWSAENCERMLVEAKAAHDAGEPPARCVCTQQAFPECPVHPTCPGCGDPVSRPGEMCPKCHAQDEAAKAILEGR